MTVDQYREKGALKFGVRYSLAITFFHQPPPPLTSFYERVNVPVPGGFSDLDWSGMRRWQLGTHTGSGVIFPKKGIHV